MLARQIALLGIGGSGSILRLPSADFAGAIEATPHAPDSHPTISAALAPTERPLVAMMPSAAPTLTPQTPQQLAASQSSGALTPVGGKTIWYIIGALVVVLVLVMVAKR